MSRLLVLAALSLIVGCASTLVMKNPTTGDVVSCGPATLIGADLSLGQTTQMERNCIDQHRQQGYVLQQP